ncbi:hypothetical protein [Bacillus sp. NPDC094106]|uniref:hypothetical protein n=1 Tax=Bacillus sp. NPDC094106 TaxID=3363949 RepID=UPI0038166BBC
MKSIEKKKSKRNEEDQPEQKKKRKGKLLLWMWLFPPYGIYILYKERRIHPILTTIITLFILSIIGLSVDMVLNPYRVHDEKAQETITKFIDKHNELDIGKFRFEKRAGTVHVDKQNLDVYKLHTTKGVYFVYLSYKNGLQYEVKEIEQEFPRRQSIYSKEKKMDVYPENLLYIHQNKDKYGEYKKVENTNTTNEQIITTTKGTYQFFTRFQQVIKVMEVKGEQKTSVCVSNPKPDFSKRTQNYIEDNKDKIGEVEELTVYNIEGDKQIFDMITTKGIYRIEEFDNGKVVLLKGEETEHDKTKK